MENFKTMKLSGWTKSKCFFTAMNGKRTRRPRGSASLLTVPAQCAVQILPEIEPIQIYNFQKVFWRNGF